MFVSSQTALKGGHGFEIAVSMQQDVTNTKEWGKSRFDEILELWIFILDYFVAPAFCLIPVS